jgi:hypothetical protein
MNRTRVPSPSDCGPAGEPLRVVGADDYDNAAVTSRSGRGQADEWPWTLTPVVDILAGPSFFRRTI